LYPTISAARIARPAITRDTSTTWKSGLFIDRSLALCIRVVRRDDDEGRFVGKYLSDR
jgi:hypothetical protein